MTVTLQTLDESSHDFRSPGRSAWTNERLAPARPPACANPAAEIPGLADCEAKVAEAQSRIDCLLDEQTKLAERIASNEIERRAQRRRVATGLALDQSVITKLSIEDEGLGDAADILAEAISTAVTAKRAAEERVRRVLFRHAQEVIHRLNLRAEVAEAEIAAITPRALTLRHWALELSLGIAGPVPTSEQIRAALKV